MTEEKNTSSILMEDMKDLENCPEALISPECRRRWRTALPERRRFTLRPAWGTAFAAAVLMLYLFGGTAVWRNNSIGSLKTAPTYPTEMAIMATGMPTPDVLFRAGESRAMEEAVPEEDESYAFMEENALAEGDSAWDFAEAEEAFREEDAGDMAFDEPSMEVPAENVPGGACSDEQEQPPAGGGYFSDMKDYLAATWPYAAGAVGVILILILCIRSRRIKV